MDISMFENAIPIESVGDFVNRIKSIKDEGESTDLFFRGQETEFWTVEPSIFRNNMLSIEHILMSRPLQVAPGEFRNMTDMFDIMTKYQHYGMCTRLLDITTNPLVALYFACKLHGEESYKSDDGTEELKEPYGVIYYKKAYPIPQDDVNVKIISELVKYELKTDNKLSSVLSELVSARIIDEDKKKRWLNKEYVDEFIQIIQGNYTILPTYNNDRLIKQSGAFLFSGMFNIELNVNIGDSIITKSKNSLRNEFEDAIFIIDGNDKESILEELDLYNINEATLFPELEHQLNYIKSGNQHKIETVPDFTRTTANGGDGRIELPYTDEEKIEELFIKQLPQSIYDMVDESILPQIIDSIKGNIVVDWYKRDSVLSKMRLNLSSIIQRESKYKSEAKNLASNIIECAVSLWIKLLSNS